MPLDIIIGMALIEIKTENFENLVLQSKVPVLVDFWATWCGPCKVLMTKLEELQTELGAKVSIVKVNIEDCPEIAQKYAVRGVPAMLLFKESQPRINLIGNQSKEAIREAFERLF